MHWQNDLLELGVRYLDLVIKAAQRDPAFAKTMFDFRTDRILLVVARLTSEQVRRAVSYSTCVFGARCAPDLRRVMTMVAKDEDAAIESAFPDYLRTGLENLQFDILDVIREESREDTIVPALSFGIADQELLQAITRLSKDQMRRMAKHPMVLRVCRAPAFEVMLNLISVEPMNPCRLATAGLAVLAHDAPSSTHLDHYR